LNSLTNPKTPSYYLWTIGCQMNRAESDRLAAQLARRGYCASPTAEEADLIILNSCVVRQHAEDKVINKLSNLKALKTKRPNLKLAVTGCLVGPDDTELKSRFPYVDYFFKPGDVPAWLDEKALPEKVPVSVFVPIIQGCNNFCTYCIVPYRRGREKSRLLQEIVAEVGELVRRGAREITLIGQNVDSYGHDLPDQPDLATLLGALNEVPGLWRLRFLTNHPKDMSPRLIEAMANLQRVCPAINLPVQAGDDSMLAAMGRGYTVAHYRQLVAELRAKVPGLAITTDVIVGFPGETAEQFQHTAELLAELRFDQVHVAAYSPREGTLAAKKLPDDISITVKKERLALIENQQERIAAEINARLMGARVEVLVDGRQKGRWQGRTRSDKLVFFSGGSGLAGFLVSVEISHTSSWSLRGEYQGSAWTSGQAKDI
jgi:tRNA-2-methylthio-N6-dimethylallyladenosine synthase